VLLQILESFALGASACLLPNNCEIHAKNINMLNQEVIDSLGVRDGSIGGIATGSSEIYHSTTACQSEGHTILNAVERCRFETDYLRGNCLGTYIVDNAPKIKKLNTGFSVATQWES